MSQDGDSILEKTARGAGWVVAWRMMTRTLGLLSTLVLVRLLAPADFGLIALASSFSVSIEAFSWIGIEEGVIRHKSPTSELMDTAFTLSVLRGAVVFLIVAAVAEPAAGFFGEPRLAEVLVALGATVLIENLINVGFIEFRRDFEFRREFQLYLLPRVLSILVAIGAAVVLRTYWALIAGIVSNQVFRVVFSYTMHPYRPRFRLSAWRQIAGYSVWNSVIAGAGALRDRVDTLMVGRAMSSASVGFYALGFEIAGLPVTELISPLTRAAFAGFAAAWREEMAAGETWLRLVSTMALLTFPAGVGMSAVAHPLIMLAFGPGWEQAVPVMQVLGIPLCLTVFGMVGQTLFLAQGHMRTSLSITIGATLLRLILLAVLIPPLGLYGAALGRGGRDCGRAKLVGGLGNATVGPPDRAAGAVDVAVSRGDRGDGGGVGGVRAGVARYRGGGNGRDHSPWGSVLRHCPNGVVAAGGTAGGAGGGYAGAGAAQAGPRGDDHGRVTLVQCGNPYVVDTQ